MRQHILLGFLLLVATILFLGPALADGPALEPWELLGAQDPLLNGLCSSGSLLFATTEEGFYYFDHQTGQWTDRTWPGWIGQAKYAVVKIPDLDQRLVSGGVNAWFKGTLFYSDDMGETETLVRESQGGNVTDMGGVFGTENTLYACTWSDVVDGEFLRSTDNGESWSPIAGHGHHAMTSLAVLTEDEVFLAGDNYVAHTTDGGLSWINLKYDLPVNQGIYCLLAQPPISGVPDLAKDQTHAEIILASNDTGLYQLDFGTKHWEMILPASCRALARRWRQTGLNHTWTETYAVTWDHRILFCVDENWDNWQDVTADLGPGYPIDVETTSWGVLVALQGGGVYRSEGVALSSGVPEVSPKLQLTAYPNPFNPATTIKFEVPRTGYAQVQVFDIRGNRVADLFRGELTVGTHLQNWRPQGLSSGRYQVVFRSGDRTLALPVVLLK